MFPLFNMNFKSTKPGVASISAVMLKATSVTPPSPVKLTFAIVTFSIPVASIDTLSVILSCRSFVIDREILIV